MGSAARAVTRSKIYLQRIESEVHTMTGGGRFDPQLDSVPNVTARVALTPEGCPPLVVRAKTGTTFDFNVHLRSATNGVALPVGNYVIEFSAECDAVIGLEDEEQNTPEDGAY